MLLKISQKSQENTQRFFFNKVAGLKSAILLKKALAQVFSSEIIEIFKNPLFYRKLLVAASGKT